MLIASAGGSSAASEGNSVTSLDQRIYLPRSSVITLSQDASSVMLANGSSGNKTQNKIISTDDRPINVFKSSSTSYMGAGTFHYIMPIVLFQQIQVQAGNGITHVAPHNQ